MWIVVCGTDLVVQEHLGTDLVLLEILGTVLVVQEHQELTW